MSQEYPTEDVLTPEELTEMLAEATGSTPEEIAKGVEIAPPREAEVVGVTEKIDGTDKTAESDAADPD